MIDYAQRQPVLEVRQVAGSWGLRVEGSGREVAVKGDGHVFVPADAAFVSTSSLTPALSPRRGGIVFSRSANCEPPELGSGVHCCSFSWGRRSG